MAMITLKSDKIKPILSLTRNGEFLEVEVIDLIISDDYGITDIEYSYDEIEWYTANWDESTREETIDNGKIKVKLSGRWNNFTDEGEKKGKEFLYVRARDKAKNESNPERISIVEKSYLSMNLKVDGGIYDNDGDVQIRIKINGEYEDGDEDGYVSMPYKQEKVEGTNWKIDGLKLNGHEVAFDREGTIDDDDTEVIIELNTIVFNVKVNQRGSIYTNKNDEKVKQIELLVPKDTEYYVNGNKVSLEDGREIVAEESASGTFFKDWTLPNSTTVTERISITANFELLNTSELIRHFNMKQEKNISYKALLDTRGDGAISIPEEQFERDSELKRDFISLNGQNQWINLGVLNHDSYKDSVTLQAEVKFSKDQIGKNSSREEVVIIGNYHNGGIGISLFNGDTIQFIVYIENMGYHQATYTYNEGIKENQLYKITGTYDGETMILYILDDEGVKVSRNIISGKIGKPAQHENEDTVMAIGVNPQGNVSQEGTYAKMSFYSARIYNTVLTKQQIEKEEKIVTDNLIKDYEIYCWWDDLTNNMSGKIIGGAEVVFENGSGYISLDGKNQWINLGLINVAEKNSITLETTIKLNSIQSGEAVVLANYSSGGVGISLWDGKPGFQVYIENHGYEKVVYEHQLNADGSVYNISGTYDGKKLILYLNGESVATKEIQGSISNPKNDKSTVMAIGTNPEGHMQHTGYANIQVNTVRIYTRALNEDEIKFNSEITKWE